MSEQPENQEQVTVEPQTVSGTPVADTAASQDETFSVQQEPETGPGADDQDDDGGSEQDQPQEAPSVPDSQSPDGASIYEQQAGGGMVAQPDPADTAHVMPDADEDPGQPGGIGSSGEAGTEEQPAVTPRSASNESTQLAPTPANGAAKALAALDHFIAVAQQIRAELDRVVPPDVRAQAAEEVARIIASA